MNKLKVIAIAGLPLTGKSTLPLLLESELLIPRLDVDEVRGLLFKHQPVDNEKDRKKDKIQMLAAWKSLFTLIDNVLITMESVIVTGTFSREYYHKKLIQIVEKHKADLRFIYCHAPDRIIETRIKEREGKENFFNLPNLDGYFRVKERYVKIPIQGILHLDTTESEEECLKKIIRFVS